MFARCSQPCADCSDFRPNARIFLLWRESYWGKRIQDVPPETDEIAERVRKIGGTTKVGLTSSLGANGLIFIHRVAPLGSGVDELNERTDISIAEGKGLQPTGIRAIGG